MAPYNIASSLFGSRRPPDLPPLGISGTPAAEATARDLVNGLTGAGDGHSANGITDAGEIPASETSASANRTALEPTSLAYELEIQRITFNQPRWLTSDSLLRDEGVHFGMGLRGVGGADEPAVQRKLDAIAEWYGLRGRVFERRIAQINAELDDIATDTAILSEEIEADYASADADEARLRQERTAQLATTEPGLVTRRTVQTVGLTLAALVQGALVFWYLAPSYTPAVTALLTATVWLLGNAGTRPRMSYYLTDRLPSARARWKQLLEDIGLPAVATLILLALGHEAHARLVSAAIAPAVYFGFAFVGRGAFRELAALPELYAARRRDRQLLKLGQPTRSPRHDERETKRRASVAELEQRGVELREERRIHELRVVSNAGESQRKRDLFLSEFHLALATPSFVDTEF